MEHEHDDNSSTGFLGGMGGLQTMGILNALRTGNPTIDLILAMCLPFLIRFLFGALGRLENFFSYERWEAWFRSRSEIHQRFITHRSTKNEWGGFSSEEDSQNTVLLKAIRLYLHSQVKLDLRDADLDLTSTEDKNSSVGRHSYCYDSDDDEADDSSRTIVGILSKYKIIRKPPRNEWHKLGSFGEPAAEVSLRIEHYEEREGDDKKTKTERVQRFHFTSSEGRAIDEFIDQAYSWYMEELHKLEDNSRYLYELKSLSSSRGGSGDEDDASSSGILYTRYRLSDEKTFDSLFFREKESMLYLIDHFLSRSGRYGIKGYPHKLGILLHGPPGSGKTSMIKALAQYTGRSIVNVPLARISTNAELMSIFFDNRKYVDGEWVPVKLGFKDVIYVMEDVDAASKIVKRRDGMKAEDMVQSEPLDLPRPKSLWRMLMEGQNDDCKDLVKLLMEKSEKLKKEALKPDIVQSVAERMLAFPGLGLVGEAGDDVALRDVGKEAIKAANSVMDDLSSVDNFLGMHARTVKSMLEAGTDVDDRLEDVLLGSSTRPFSGLDKLCLPQLSACQSRDTDTEPITPSDSIVTSMAHFFEEKKDDSPRSDDKKLDGLGRLGPLPWMKPFSDQLNLTGLLNVLDGVVDTPGRIVIMTTNHVEHLDPALIRPGRIDKKLLLGFMSATDIIAMLEHYFQVELDDNQCARVETAIIGLPHERKPQLRLTPAQVEQLTAEYDDIEDMIKALEAKARPLILSKSGF